MTIMKSDLMYLDKIGVYVGEFNEEQLRKGIHKKIVDKYRELTGLKYTNTKLTKNENKEQVLRIWLCELCDCKDLK